MIFMNMPGNKNKGRPKIALVYDRVVKFGGAERILLALNRLWPDAPLYTAVYNNRKVPWARKIEVKTSFLKYLPIADRYQEILPFLTPYVFENFNFDDFDIVISVTSSDAKSIVTKPGTLHICYCLTPTRYLWSGYEEYLKEPGVGLFNPLARLILKTFLPHLRHWDYLSSARVDQYLSISQTVQKRIWHYYKRKAQIIYPPAATHFFRLSKNKPTLDYYLIVSRLVPYKSLDYAIKAINRLKTNLIIIGSGIDRGRLRSLAGPTVKFIEGNLTDRKLCWYYQNCRSLIFPGEEDFGLTAVEAQACGRPVIALNKGGAAESIRPGLTGLLYEHKSEESLIDTINKFEKMNFEPHDCRENSLKFAEGIFEKRMKETILNFWKEGNWA